MNKPRLTYFDAPVSRGEECRLALHVAGVDFEDVRLKREQWAALKPNAPYGTLPFFEMEGHPTIGQTNAILVLVGRQHGMHPKDDFEAARHESMMCHVEDLRGTVGPTIRITDEDEKKRAREDLVASYLPTWAAFTEKHIGDHGFFAGDAINVVDVKLYLAVRWFAGGKVDYIPANVFSSFPKLTRVYEAVGNHPRVKDWYARALEAAMASALRSRTAVVVALALSTAPRLVLAQDAPPETPTPVAPAPSPPSDDRATLDFTSDAPLTLFARPTGDEGPFSALCAAPCSAKLVPGRYSFALARPGDEPRPAARLVIGGSGAVTGTYESMKAYRYGGVAVLVLGLSLATYLVLTSPDNTVCDAASPCGSSRPGGAKLLLGIATGAASLGVGVWMLTMKDRVTLSVVPGVASPPRTEGASAWTGLSVRATF